MSPLQRRLAAAAVLCAIFAPWGAVIVTAAHLALEHHEAEEPHHYDEGALHGHGHSADTPEHGHDLALTGGVDKGLRPPLAGVTLTLWAHFAATSTSRGFIPCPAASPPRLAPIVLRT